MALSGNKVFHLKLVSHVKYNYFTLLYLHLRNVFCGDDVASHTILSRDWYIPNSGNSLSAQKNDFLEKILYFIVNKLNLSE